jgi:hypothetical protein
VFDRLDDAQQHAGTMLLLRMIRISDGNGRDSCRRELSALNVDPVVLSAVQRLVGRRSSRCVDQVGFVVHTLLGT